MADMEMGVNPSTGPLGDRSQHEGAYGEKSRAAELGGTARRKVMERVDGQKDQWSQSLENLASSLEHLDEGPQKPLTDAAARYIRKGATLLRDHTADDLANQAVAGLRQRPAALIGGAFVLGFLGARLLKT